MSLRRALHHRLDPDIVGQTSIPPAADLRAWRAHPPPHRGTHYAGSARPGRHRRNARFIPVPSTLEVEVPAQTVEVLGWAVAEQRPEVPGCAVAVDVTWSGLRQPSLQLVPSQRADWQALRIAAPGVPRVTNLRLELTATPQCPKQVGRWIALSELLPIQPAVPTDRPNIVLVVLDAARRDHVDCDASSSALLPEIQQLCRRGVFFGNAFSTSSWTYPAVASMLTGHQPAEHGARRRQQVGWIDPKVTTLPEILRWAGYHTAAVIPNPYAGRGLWRGFDVFWEMHPPGALRQESRRASEVVDQAIDWLRTESIEPFFLWTLFVDAHTPVDAGLEMGAPGPACEGAELTVGWEGLAGLESPSQDATKRMACRKHLYGQSLRYLDRELGRLLQEIDDQGLTDRTAVLLVADHGEELWDHANAEPEVPRERRGIDHGHTHFAELIHVPLLVVPPGGNTPPQRTSPSLVSVTDIFATALDFAGLSQPIRAEAHSLRGLLGDHPNLSLRNMVRADDTLYGPQRRSVTTPALRAIWTAANDVTVFDRMRDPTEQSPLAADSPLYRRGAALLLPSPQSAHDENSPQLPDDVSAALRALGYVE